MSPSQIPNAYRVFGVLVRANVAIPHLTPSPGSELEPHIDIAVRRQLEPADVALMTDLEPGFTSRAIHEASGQPALRVWSVNEDGARLFRHGDGTTVHVNQAGTTMTIVWPDHHDDPWEFVLSFVIAFALRQHGMLCLHAAAVAARDAAVLLLGRPGTGKSTLATGLSLRGHAVLTDDVAVIERQGESMAVHSGPRVIRPRRSALSVLGKISDERRLPSAPNLEWLLIDPDVAIAPPLGDPVRIDTIYLLDPHIDSPGVAAVPLAPSALTVELIADAWATQLADRTMQAQEFERVGQLVSSTRAERLLYNPGEADWVDRVSERILG